VNRITVRALAALAVLLAACGLAGDLPSSVPGCAELPEGASAGDGDVLTPYAGMGGGQFLRGATLDLDQAGPLDAQLRTMRDRYRIDTVGVYRLDAPGPFFAALGRLGMTTVLRLEEYDPESFAFTGADVDRLLARYADLLAEATAHHSLVAYLAVNMPLDDPRVQDRLGGVNSPLSIERQAAYASAVVARLRQVAPGLPIYLGVFYGWDGEFRPPSYRSAGADGYFLTSYSYPGSRVAGHEDGDAALIDADRRRAVMRRFLDQYGDAPVVVEYGVQTAEHHSGQTAGLVADRAAKRRALAAITRFYCVGYANVRGTMYFGFNIVKTEGLPPGTVDFRLA